MKNFLSPRLAVLLECAEKCRVLADIGTDHAYLPIEAVRAGLCERAMACDIAAGPLEIAEKNIFAAGLENRIETRLGDGLAPFSPGEADCIVIAGMGGMRIMEILSESISDAPEKIGNAKLILQPQHDLEDLRRFLHANGFIIIEEKLAYEINSSGERFYVILTAQSAEAAGVRGITPWSDAEYFLGKISGGDSAAYYLFMHKKISGYINSVTDENARKLAEKRLFWLEKKLEEGTDDNYVAMDN